MLLLNNVTTQDKYVPAATLGPVPTTEKIVYVVANQPVLCQVASWQPSKTEGTWSDEILVTPQTAEFQRVTGVRFRSALPGKPAQVIAQLIEPGDPIPVGGTPFTAALAASGGLTPGNVSVQFQKDGTLVATEPILNILTTLGLATMVDSPANTRVDLTLPLGCAELASIQVPAPGVISFTSIPQTYRHLAVIWWASANGPSETLLSVNLNGDFAANYDTSILDMNNGVFATGRTNPNTSLTAGVTGNTSALASGVFFIPGYSFQLTGKNLIGFSAGTAIGGRLDVGGGRWTPGNTGIFAVTLSAGGGNLLPGSVATLYGFA